LCGHSGPHLPTMTRTLPSSLRRTLLLGGLAAALPARATRAITTEGITFVGDIRLANAPLQLNGVGWRAVAWARGYAAALYLPRRAASEAEVLQQAGAKRLRMHLVQDVDAEEFVKAFAKGVQRNTPAPEQTRLRERVTQFNTVVRGLGKLRKQDVIDLDFIPGRGLVLSRNGAARGTPVDGEDFYAALLRCFIGQRPADPDMKTGLLGGPVG
jgi:Chalcone isomerase-like